MIINSLSSLAIRKVLESQYKSPVSVLVLLSLVVTVVMIVLNMIIEPSESGIATPKIITAFIAGMFGYTTLDLLKHLYLK